MWFHGLSWSLYLSKGFKVLTTCFIPNTCLSVSKYYKAQLHEFPNLSNHSWYCGSVSYLDVKSFMHDIFTFDSESKVSCMTLSLLTAPLQRSHETSKFDSKSKVSCMINSMTRKPSFISWIHFNFNTFFICLNGRRRIIKKRGWLRIEGRELYREGISARGSLGQGFATSAR